MIFSCLIFIRNRMCYTLENVEKLMVIFFTSMEFNLKYPEFRTKCWMIEPCSISYFMPDLFFILIWNKWNYIKIIPAFYWRPSMWAGPLLTMSHLYFSLNLHKLSLVWVVLPPFSHDKTEAQKREKWLMQDHTAGKMPESGFEDKSEAKSQISSSTPRFLTRQ